MHGLPKLVAIIGSQFHHMFETGLAVESLEKVIDIDFFSVCVEGGVGGLLETM